MSASQKTIRLKKITALACVIIGLFFVNSSIATASTIYGKSCRIKVFPYDIAGANEEKNGQDAEPYLSTIPDNLCPNHLEYTQQRNYASEAPYKNTQPPSLVENTLSEDAAGIFAPVASHEHAYFNDSPLNADPTHYYMSTLRKFQITIFWDDDNDGILNIDPEHMACSMPIDPNYARPGDVATALNDCDIDVGEFPDLYDGGLSVHKEDFPNEKKSIVTWEFGIGGKLMPTIWGKNGNGDFFYKSNGAVFTLRDLNHNHNLRTLGADGNGFAVYPVSATDVPDEIWSATSTSRAYIADYAIDTNLYDRSIAQNNVNTRCEDNPGLGWCSITPANYAFDFIQNSRGTPIPNYWYPIGSVTSIWRKPSVPPPPPEVHLTIKKIVQNADGSINHDGLENDFELFTLREEENNQPRGRGQNGGVQLGNAGGFFDRLIGEGDTATQFASGQRTNFEHNVAQVVEPGTYIISEEPKDGYTQIGIKCNGEPLKANNQVTITDRDVTCTINNRIVEEEFTCPADRPIPHNNKCYKFPYPGPIPPVVCEPGTSEDENGVCIPDTPVNPIPTICVIRNGVVLPNIPVNTQLPGDAACNGGGGGGGGVLIPGNNFPGVALEPFRFEKTAFRSGTSSNMIQEGDNVSYDLKFIATLPQSGALIKDDSFDQNRRLRGSTENSSLVIQPNNFYDRNLIDDEFKVFKNNSSEPLPECRRSNRATDCYLGNPFVGEGVRVNTPLAMGEFIRVHFDARLVTSRLNCQGRQNDTTGFCGETFPNIAHAIGDNGVSREARASLYTPCPFLLTRGIGDIIIGSDFQYGFDTSGLSCAGVPNIEGEIIFPEVPPEEFISPGAGSDGPAPVAPEGVCKRSNDANSNNPEDYKNPAKLLSSGICELKLNVTEQLTHDVIEKSITDNVARFTRTPANLQTDTINGDAINNGGGVQLPNPNYAVYKAQGDLHVSGTVGAGSRTYIVQDHDLIIDGNIKFNNDVANGSFKNTPSIAFIVINGNIRINQNVTELDGVFVALQGSRGAENSGKITGAQSDKPLVFDGAVVGDIEPLFRSRTFTGDAKRNEGTIVINYGAWLYYNLPPVLRDIIDLQQIQTAR